MDGGQLVLLKKYGAIGVLSLIALIFLIYTLVLNSQVLSLKDEYATLSDTVLTMQAELDSATADFNADEESRTIRESAVSATDVGTQIVELNNLLASYYRSIDPFAGMTDSMKAEFLQQIDDAEIRWQAITNETNVTVWTLNSNWTLTLETVINYRATDQIPILFSMTMVDGTPAGIVTATYDVASNTLVNVVKHYTDAGQRDKVDVGGA